MLKNKNLLAFAPLVILALAALPVLASLAAGAQRNLFWNGDYAIFLIDMHHASSFQQALGISSRFGWAHPGPLNYYLLLPFYWVTNAGVQSLMLGTAVLNLACLLGSAAIIARLGGRAAAGIFLLVISWFLLVAIGPYVIWDVLLPRSTILPWVLALCLACAVAIEGLRWSPLLAFVLCFLAQAHVSLWLPCAFLGIAAVGMAVYLRRRVEWWWGAAALAIGLFLWLPPLLEWDNLTRIFRHFTTARSAEHSVWEALQALASLIGQATTGGPVYFVGSDPSDANLVAGIGLMATALVAVVQARRNRFVAVFGALTLGSAAVFVFSLTRFTGPIMHHSILFMTALGPLLLVLVVTTLLPRSEAAVPALAAAGCLALVAFVWGQTHDELAIAKAPTADVRELSAALATELQGETKTIFIEQPVWPVAMGAVAQVYRDGADFRIQPFWAIVFGGHVEKMEQGPAVKISASPAGVVVQPAR